MKKIILLLLLATPGALFGQAKIPARSLSDGDLEKQLAELLNK
jgi:hypothetical protein